MARKTKKSLEVEHREVPVQVVYSNELGIGYSDTEVVINFAFSTPRYLEPHNDVEVPVARVILTWEVAETLLETLKGLVEKHKKPQKPKRKVKSRS